MYIYVYFFSIDPYFHCATVEDDPDTIRSKQREYRTKTELEVLKEEIDDIIQNIIANHPEEKERLGKMVTKKETEIRI